MRNFFGCLGFLLLAVAVMALPAVLAWGIVVLKALLAN
jgi:hypothetical protein